MKVRFRFAKLGKVRWTSHRDVARMWERALRRARLPLAYTAGFSPRPQLSFGLALPTGCSSTAEYLEAVLTAEVDPAGLPGLLSPLLPAGVDVAAAAAVPPGAGSLQEEVTSCTWEIELPLLEPAGLPGVIARALGAGELPVQRERKGRLVLDDLRPSVISLSPLEAPGPGSLLLAELATRPRGVRPSELARVLGVDLGPACRTMQWIEREGSRWEPLAVEAACAVRGLDRAS